MDLFHSKKGELIISKINLNQGAIAINTFDNLVCSTHYQPYQIDTNLLNLKYFVMTLRSETFLNSLNAIKSNGIKNEFTTSQIGILQIPLPTKDIQINLVNNYENILQQAEQAEQQANQLEKDIEIKQNEAKTKNKLHFVDFENISKWGVEFILSVSETLNKKYPTKKIADLCKVSSGGTPSRSVNAYYQNGDILWVKTTEVRNDIITDTEEKITKLGLENSSAKIYPSGSLLIAMYGQGLTRGRTAKLAVPAATNQACAVLHEIDNSQIETDFLWLYIQGEYERLRALASGNNQPNLNAQMIANYEVTIPPTDIQTQIVNHINTQKTEIKKLRLQAKTLKESAKNNFESAIFE
jgi:restriction endonuclease S subunit